MAITITPNIQPASVPAAPAAAIVLQPGQVITAQVVQVLGNDQVQLAIGGQTIAAATQVPLQVGQSLHLQVSQTPGGIGLAIVNSIVNQPSTSASQANASAAATSDSVTLAPSLAASLSAATPTTPSAPTNPLTLAETFAVTLAAQTAATQQTSLAPLFANLDVAAGLNLPPQVLQAVTQVFAQQTNLDQNLTGNVLKQAFQSSGLFLESAIAAGSGLSSNGGPDLKAALIVLRQALSTSLASASGTSNTATPVTVPQPGATASQGSVPEGPTSGPASAGAPASEPTSEPASTGSISAPANTAQPGTAPAALASAPAGQSASQESALALTISAELAAQEVPAPSIVPQASTAAGSVAASTQAAAPAVAQEILELAAANQATATTSTSTDAVARAAASSAALNLLQEAVQAVPLAAANLSRLLAENGQALALLPVVTGVRTPAAVDDAEFARTNLPPPPVNGALPTAQPVAPATLSPHAPLETTLQHLLSDTDGAIARQTLLQIASLPGQSDPSATRADTSTPRWNFEIPFATAQGTAMAQFEISRDGGGRDVDPAKRVWRARFSLDVEPAGPVHALVSLNGDRTSVRMWAERPATASQLRAGVSQLTQALSRAELNPGEIVVRDGAPSQATPVVAGHFLDRAS
jgi:hypothetical protein